MALRIVLVSYYFITRASPFSPPPSLHQPTRCHSVSSSSSMKSDPTAAVRRSSRKRTSKQNNDDAIEIPPTKRRPVPPAAAIVTTSSESDNSNLLQSWLQHNHHSYHLSFLSPSRAYEIRTALVTWYRLHRRKLPWRGDMGPYDGSTAGFSEKKKRGSSGGDIRSFFRASSGEEKKQDDTNNTPKNDSTNKKEISAYGVWVSEIMLQQTRVEAVIPYYLKWMQSFPTVESLANATPEEVNAHWAGLGFYRRARLLHRGAQRVVSEYGGVVPNTVDELMKVEGIGRYTASAIASIACGVKVPVVDGNVCRVLSRLTGVANHIKASVFKDDLGWVLAEAIVQARPSGGSDSGEEAYGSPGEVNQALMELGATYCSPSGSGVEEGDPLKQFYVSTKLGVAIRQFMKCNSLHSIAPTIGLLDNQKCKLCDPDGVSSAFYDIADRIRGESKAAPEISEKQSALAGHAALPMPPPKKAKREEVLAVAVLCLKHQNKADNRWLMVKRPSEGLLAGQLEFPSVCVWDSSKNEAAKGKKTKPNSGNAGEVQVPHIKASIRSDELNSYLQSIFESNDTTSESDESESSTFEKRVQIKEPIVHVFSHVCHTMYVEKCHISSSGNTCFEKRWKTADGREVGWFSEKEMNGQGITSGVRKVLALTETCAID